MPDSIEKQRILTGRARSLENLKKGRRWKPGESGNPKGRPPKHLCLTSKLWDFLHEKCPLKEAQGKTWLDIIVYQIAVYASKGNASIIKEIWDRLEGKVVQPISNPDGTSITNFTDEQIEKMIAAYKLIKRK